MAKLPSALDRVCYTVAALPPRLVPSSLRLAPVANTASLLLVALVGASLVHLLAYHLSLAVPFGERWVAVARDLLTYCPLVSLLSGVILVALVGLLLVGREVHRLDRLNAALSQRLMVRHVPLMDERTVLPRSPLRLLRIIGVLLVVQVAALSLYAQFCPMHVTMVMNGVPMQMPMTAVLPLLPLHLAVAALLGLCIWRIECRIVSLRECVAVQLRLLVQGPIGAIAAFPLPSPARRLPQGWCGEALFARPPPVSRNL